MKNRWPPIRYHIRNIRDAMYVDFLRSMNYIQWVDMRTEFDSVYGQSWDDFTGFNFEDHLKRNRTLKIQNRV